MKLNAEQKKAIEYINGPLLVLAGAGTGKTRVLTERIIYILNSYHALADEILSVTFTNKAANEMKSRVFNQIGEEANNIWMGTFHGIATKILRRHSEKIGFDSDFTIIDQDDSIRMIKKILKELNIDVTEFPAKNYSYQIQKVKDKGILPENIKNSKFSLPNFKNLYEIYQNRLKNNNSVDFGDILLYNLIIFTKNDDILTYYQEKFKFILVDEFQDTNFIQYLWLKKLSDKYKNICCVGDDDQLIYSWRGAQIENILQFEKDFKKTKIIRLEQNYRSVGNILKIASHLISNNKERYKKKLWSKHEDGNGVKLNLYNSDRDEAKNICKKIKYLQITSELNKMAILVRAGYQTRAIEEACINASLPYRIIGGLKFFDRKEIKDIIAYLKLIKNQNNNIALFRIINLPKRGVGVSTIDKLSQESNEKNISIFNIIKKSIENNSFSNKIHHSLVDFMLKIEKWRHLYEKDGDLQDLAAKIVNESGYLSMLYDEKSVESSNRIENIKEFIRSLDDFSNLDAFLDHISLISDNDSIKYEDQMINIMTIHASKGLEFDSVFIPGLEEGIFPGSKSITDKEIEEERRLLYVAITRAKRHLFLSCAKNRFIFGSFQNSIPSRFLLEIKKYNTFQN